MAPDVQMLELITDIAGVNVMCQVTNVVEFPLPKHIYNNMFLHEIGNRHPRLLSTNKMRYNKISLESSFILVNFILTPLHSEIIDHFC